MIDVKFRQVHGDLPAPSYKTMGAAGCDLVSAEGVVLDPGERLLVSTGLHVQLPVGFEGQIRSRSGFALDQGIIVLNSPGTVDSDYRGELGVLLYNTSKDYVIIKRGYRIAQLVISPVVQARFTQATSLNDTVRGFKGWGSTGKI